MKNNDDDTDDDNKNDDRNDYNKDDDNDSVLPGDRMLAVMSCRLETSPSQINE